MDYHAPTQFAPVLLEACNRVWSPSYTKLRAAGMARAAFNLILLFFATIYAISHRKDWRKMVSIYITY